MSLDRKATLLARPPWVGSSSGVQERGMFAQGFPRNLGELIASSARIGWETEDQNPGLPPSRPTTAGAKKRARPRYLRAKATKRGEKGVQQSELPIVPQKPGNPSPGDSVEERGNWAVGPMEGKMSETLSSTNVTTKLQRIAKLAREHPKRVFTSIAHVIDVEWMREAYRLTRKDGAAGVDGKGVAEIASALELNLQALVDALKSGTYRPPPVRQTYIPKGEGKQRPIGIDALEHKHLRRFLDQRVRDGVIRKVIDKWLKAGVLEEGILQRFKMGTPQGGVVSPILANIYLNHVLDAWFENEVRRRVGRRARIIRYADDFVLLFGKEEDARRVFAILPKRFARYGLSLHPAKTRLIPFTSPE